VTSIVERIWAYDASLWTDSGEDQWLGWLDVVPRVRVHVDELNVFSEAATEQFHACVLLGMGGSSLAPEVLRRTFNVESFHVLDTTHPEALRRLERSVDLEQTLFLASSKSGSTIETRSHLEYFWERCREQGNPHGFTIEDFRYPGHPPQSRETAILAICDAVEAASRTLKKPDAAAIDSLVQRIVYGKLHLGQLDESGLSMSDLRRISDSLRETIRHANHGRIEYPWEKAGQDASASVMSYSTTSPSPRLDSLDRRPSRNTTVPPSVPPPDNHEAALAATADVKSSASDPRSPAANPPPNAEPSNAVKIRAGTARNANPSSPPALALEGSATRTPREAQVTITGRAPGPLAPQLGPSTAPKVSKEPPPAASSFDHEPPPAASSFDLELRSAVNAFDPERLPGL
jgi:hypothetical protein